MIAVAISILLTITSISQASDSINEMRPMDGSWVCTAYICGSFGAGRNQCRTIYGARKSSREDALDSLVEVCGGGCGSSAHCWND